MVVRYSSSQSSILCLWFISICFPSQECLDCTFSWFRGLASFPLLPSAQEEEDEEDEGLPENMKETAKEKEERKSDHDVARQDVVKVNKHHSFNAYFTCSTCLFIYNVL